MRAPRAVSGSPMADRVPPLALAGVAAVLWGTLGVTYKLGVVMGADLEVLVAGRPLAAGIIAAAWAWLFYRETPRLWSVAIAVFGLAPLYTVYPLAVVEAGAAVASILLYTAPAWVAIGARIALGEPLSARRVAIVALGVTGAALVSGSPEGSVTLRGALLGLASGASYAAYMLLARLAGMRGATTAQVALYPVAISAPLVALAVRPSRAPDPMETVFTLYLAVACTLLPYILHTRALRRAEAGRVAVVSLLEPLTAVVLAWLLLGESLAAIQLLGAALILFSAYMAYRG